MQETQRPTHAQQLADTLKNDPVSKILRKIPFVKNLFILRDTVYVLTTSFSVIVETLKAQQLRIENLENIVGAVCVEMAAELDKTSLQTALPKVESNKPN